MKRWKFINDLYQIWCLTCFYCLIQKTCSLTVDNELVSARNDCFERVALEAMIPFEKTFKTEDTNSLRMCKEKCLQADDKCQSMSFGVHRRGNGTCQLSKEKYKIGSRPNGVIFDPDFDLYVRKTNCFDLADSNLQDHSDNLEHKNGYGSNLTPIAPVLLPSRPSEGTPIVLVEQSPTVMTTLQDESTHYASPTAGYGGGVAGGGEDPSTFFTQQPTSTYEPNTQKIPSTPATANGDRLYFSQDIYPLYKYPTLYEPNYPAPNQDVYLPGGYAANAQEVEYNYRPNAFDSNVKPSASTNHPGPPKPIFGLGYGTGYGYSKPESYNPATMRPQDTGYSSNTQTPNNMNRDTPSPSSYENSNRDPYRLESYDNEHRDRDPLRPAGYDVSTPVSSYYPRPDIGQSSTSNYGNNANNDPNSQPELGQRPYHEPNSPPSYSTRPSNDHNSPSAYEPTPEYNRNPSPSYGPSRPSSERPGSLTDFTNRPDPPDVISTPSSYGSNFNNNHMRRNGTAAASRPDTDDKHINTYFNPDDYLMGNKKRPGSYETNYRPDYNRGPMKACFRRVLAGKRIAPHWVRRTIACERVEECMRECGREKRFTCEGFNYRLDPSGHGQGDCELIEIPLAEIDLYSSPNRRDSNLLRHPDYDYYERDRNAPHSCKYNMCKECSTKLPLPPPLTHYNKPSQVWSEKPFKDERFPHLPPPPSSSGSGFYSRPSSSSASLEHYPSGPSSHSSFESHGRPPYSYEHQSGGSYEFSSHGSGYYEHSPPSSYGSSGSEVEPIDRYDVSYGDRYRPSHTPRWESIPSSSGYDGSKHEHYRPAYRPGPDYIPYRTSGSHASTGPDSYRPGPPPSAHNYLDRDHHSPTSSYKKNAGKFVPYLIGTDNEWGSYGGSYGGSNSKQTAYWGLSDSRYKPRDPVNFDYSSLGPAPSKSGGFRGEPPHESNALIPNSGSNYGSHGKYDGFRDRHDYTHQWTRRPGPDECSAKTSEGFRLHKKIVKHMYSTPSLTECERLCSGQDAFICHTYSYKYSSGSHDNCMLCDRPINHLDYYVDIEPDRDYDIYSMADDLNVCRKNSRIDGPTRLGGSNTALADPRSTQCFFRAIDATRFYTSIVRDSLTVRSVGECEMECIKSTKFTCRAFAFRYGQQRHASVIDNCQLSDWPVRDMDKERHLILDKTFDIFERASYGHGCEIQPIVDEKHKKSVCYLGYGSPAKLLPHAIKKVITVPSELECKKECIRLRDSTAFKCYAFSYGSRKTTFNCEMSDCDQTELKLNVHFTHTDDKDYWLFAWNPFDYTCRDKVNTIGGSRVKNNRRMDIFKEPDVAWRHYSVSGKPCRRSSPCEKNIITGFYSCEIEGGEIGSWDYCCKVDHPCGYSQGFDYPWCFVGDEPDQWRKCSDRYYPGNHTLTHSGLIVKTLKHSDKRKPTDSFTSASNSDEYQKPPRPGGLQSLSDFTAARLWPVTYLYSEGPPNSTEFSNFVDCNKETC